MLATLGLCLAMAQTTSEPYSEPLRPQFHFTAQKGWLNDPNGLVYFKGEYHLFFQHNPFGTEWGNMTWGHAVSKDLVHWTQLPEAIEPDALGTIFSGSAAVDQHGTAGFGNGALVCMYTAAGGTNDASKGKPFTQCLAYSTDGRTFHKFEGNPVLPHIEGENRDPKLIWYSPTHTWILALYLDGNRYALFSSIDLKHWTKTCDVDMSGTSECPDFFELPIDGGKKWVFWGANGNYRVGRFDGKVFTPETNPIRSNFGNTSYAAQTYFNDPKGRRVQIAWLRDSNFPDTAWNQQMGFPAELKLRATSQGPRLSIYPVEEIKSLHGPKLKGKDGWYASASGLLDIDARFEVPESGVLALTVNGRTISYDVASQTLQALGKRASVPPVLGRLDLRILADRASIEIYAQSGLVYMPLFTLPETSERGFRVQTTRGWKAEKMDVYVVRSAW
ncbi:MAG TPA: glycoside hydrolase family 32 protein [Fimbriimonadaceae bacterium]|nr:glycoside hydrolase family 32 protein [Fimbriimonadaceae bacterium]